MKKITSLAGTKPGTLASRFPALLAALAAAAPLATWAQQAPSVVIVADDERFVVPLKIDGKVGAIDNYFIERPGFTINISATLNSDPFIAYGLAVTDFGAPSAFSFIFSTPIVPTGPLTTVQASISGGLTDVTGNGVSLTPTAAKTQTSSVSAPPTSMGVDVGDLALHGPGSPGALYTYGPYAAGPMAGPVGIWTGLSTTAAFTLSGDGDIAALTGFASVNTATTVPDGGVGLVAIPMIIGLLAAGRRASKQQLS